MPFRWLVFVHQLPARPSNARVRIWRRLQQIGAVPVKNAVHVLPESTQAIEDFEWLRGEVVALGGQAATFGVPSMKAIDERPIVGAFQAASADEFSRIRKEMRAMRTTVRRASPPRDVHHQQFRALQERFDRVSGRDRFGARGGSEAAVEFRQLAAELRSPSKRRMSSPRPSDAVEAYRNRVWVTRPRPGVDRFSSAWLIRRFVDGGAAFVFAQSPDRYPEAVPFDMYQSGGFRHEADRCTFEVIQARFGIQDHAVTRIGEIVHDIDLKEERYKSPHMATVANLVDGLRASFPDDAALLEQGMIVFEALYISFSSAKTPKKRVVYT